MRADDQMRRRSCGTWSFRDDSIGVGLEYSDLAAWVGGSRTDSTGRSSEDARRGLALEMTGLCMTPGAGGT